MFRGLGSVIYKESIHIARDPRTLFMMLAIPGLQLTIFGYAIDTDVEDIRTAVYNLDGRAESRELIDAFVNTGYFDVKRHVLSDDALYESIVSGDVKVGIRIPPDYTDRLLLEEPVHVQVLIDGSDSRVAQQALNTANGLAMDRSLRIAAERLDVAVEQPLQMRPRMLFNPGMKTVNFMVPGLISVILQLVTMFLTAFAVVREEENGTLEQLMVTPVSRGGLMLGKIVPFGIIGMVETASVLLLMRFLFGVSVEGNLSLLALFSLLYVFTGLGMGLLISTIANTQMEAVQMAYAVMLPSVLLSGFIFPQHTMPAIIYWLAQLLPATYFIEILRGIILRGAGFRELWQEGAMLVAMAAALLLISTLRFRKTLT